MTDNSLEEYHPIKISEIGDINYVDESNCNVIDESSVVSTLSSQIFGSTPCSDIIGIICDSTMQTLDIFCMLIDILLHGVKILTDNEYTINNIDNEDLDLINKIKSKFSRTQFQVEIKLDGMYDNNHDYRTYNNYHAEIVDNNSDTPTKNTWYILNYKIFCNFDLYMDSDKQLDKIYFIIPTPEKYIYRCNFCSTRII